MPPGKTFRILVTSIFAHLEPEWNAVRHDLMSPTRQLENGAAR